MFLKIKLLIFLLMHVKFSASDGGLLDNPMGYRELVGCLIMLILPCPDISYLVYIVSWFVSAPRSSAALLCILCYVHGTIYQCLLLFSTSSSLPL